MIALFLIGLRFTCYWPMIGSFRIHLRGRRFLGLISIASRIRLSRIWIQRAFKQASSLVWKRQLNPVGFHGFVGGLCPTLCSVTRTISISLSFIGSFFRFIICRTILRLIFFCFYYLASTFSPLFCCHAHQQCKGYILYSFW
jgi:hypothetical protein